MTTANIVVVLGWVLLFGATIVVYNTPPLYRWRSSAIYLLGGYTSGALLGVLLGGG